MPHKIYQTEEIRSHYQTSSIALLFVGIMGCCLGMLSMLLGSLPMMDGEAMMVTGLFITGCGTFLRCT